MRNWAWGLLIVASLGLVTGSSLRILPIGMVEVFGFVSGAVCVLLVVQQHIANFPVGLLNNVVFIMLFMQARLYGDMAMQLVYIVLGIIGWYQWLYGGARHTQLTVSRTPWWEWVVLLSVGVPATLGMLWFLRVVHGAAPLLDAITTVLSLLAQYLLNRKRLENWLVWITADILYIYLYSLKGLYLTAVLYAIFIGLCVAGWLAWQRSLATQQPEPAVEGVA